MSKTVIYILLSFIQLTGLFGQQRYIDSLQREINTTENDTLTLVHFTTLSDAYSELNPDSSLFYSEQLLQLSRKLNFKLNEAFALTQLGYAFLSKGNHPRSLQLSLDALAIAEDPRSEQNVLPDKYINKEEFLKQPITAHVLRLTMLGFAHANIGTLYENTNNYSKELFHFMQVKQVTEQTGNIPQLCTINMSLGRLYLILKKPDSALIYEQQAYDLSIKTNYKRFLGSVLLNLGRINLAKGNKQLAEDYFRKAIIASRDQDYLRGITACNLLLADLYNKPGRWDSSLYYANVALATARQLNAPDLLRRCYTSLSSFYRLSNNKDSLVKYQELLIKINDSTFNSAKAQQFENIDFNEKQRRREMEAAREGFQNRLRMYGLLTGLGIFLLLAAVLWRNNQHRKKANAQLHKQNEELQATLRALEATQAQLIQSEKMASLGELTAGIAHEIQNPLNFVNNFSEVNKELVDELQTELKSGNLQEAVAISNDIKDNEEKISHHGKRADAIVKGMLQHSRSSGGIKEPTDINALADEYLRLAYHGVRAKDNSFNVTMKTEFDESIGNINIIPQDIGRVLLNLYNNAFYAVNEKKKLQSDYEPIITVVTRSVKPPLGGWGVSISVKDNGNGIPQKVIDKIFQPFFTTKPTGQGTGLGLSMSYDIIKAHGGELEVSTKEGEFAEFMIQLPMK